MYVFGFLETKNKQLRNYDLPNLTVCQMQGCGVVFLWLWLRLRHQFQIKYSLDSNRQLSLAHLITWQSTTCQLITLSCHVVCCRDTDVSILNPFPECFIFSSNSIISNVSNSRFQFWIEYNFDTVLAPRPFLTSSTTQNFDSKYIQGQGLK